MTAQEILALAQQGNPAAIATLLNLILEPKGIKARAQRQDDRLHILLESPLPPIQSEAVEFIRNSLDDLPVEGVKTVTIYGRQRGETRPGWSETIERLILEPKAAKSEAPIPVGHDPGSTRPSAGKSAATQLPGAIGTLHSDEFSAPKTDLIAVNSSRDAIDTGNVPAGLLDPLSLSETTLLPLGDSEASKVLKRPEAVICIICVTLVIFWDTYTSLLDGEGISTRTALSTSQLARRLKTSKRVIRRRKRLPDFKEWSQSLDPNGIAWEYHGGAYVAQSTAYFAE